MERYWTIWSYGTLAGLRVCSEHKSWIKAIEHADKCEARGGAHHEIYKIEKVPRTEKERRALRRKLGLELTAKQRASISVAGNRKKHSRG